MEYQDFLKKEIYGNLRGRNKFLARYVAPSTNAVFIIRKMQNEWGKNNKFSKRYAHHLSRKLVKKYGIYIYPDVKIGIGLKLPHPNGIIIGKSVEIGENCTIFQQVTIGSSHPGDYLKGKQPLIGNNVWLFAGSKVLGDIRIANYTLVGANAVLLHDTEEGKSYVGVPAKVTKSLKNTHYVYE